MLIGDAVDLGIEEPKTGPYEVASFSNTWRSKLPMSMQTLGNLGGLVGLITSLGVLWAVFQGWESKASAEQVKGLIENHDAVGHQKLRSDVASLREKMKRLERLQLLQYYTGLYRADVAEWYSKRQKGPKPRKSDYRELTRLEAEMGFVGGSMK